MLYLKEIKLYENNRIEETKILINPLQITTIRQEGMYSFINTVDNQTIKVKDSVHDLNKMLGKYNLSLSGSEVVAKS